MVTGHPPFMNEDKILLMDAIVSHPFKWPLNKFPNGVIPSALKNIVESLLDKNVDTRLGCNGIHDIKSHPYFKGIEFVKVFNKK